MSVLKRKLILISCFFVFSLHIYCLIKKENIYPFVEYNMFSKAKTAPIYNTLYLFAVDTSGFEFPIDKNKPFFLKPYNQRGFYHALTKSITKNGPSDILYSIGMKVKKNVRDTKSIRLYDLMCSCSYFTELSNSRLPQYLNSHCKKRLLNEVQLQ